MRVCCVIYCFDIIGAVDFNVEVYELEYTKPSRAVHFIPVRRIVTFRRYDVGPLVAARRIDLRTERVGDPSVRCRTTNEHFIESDDTRKNRINSSLPREELFFYGKTSLLV